MHLDTREQLDPKNWIIPTNPDSTVKQTDIWFLPENPTKKVTDVASWVLPETPTKRVVEKQQWYFDHSVTKVFKKSPAYPKVKTVGTVEHHAGRTYIEVNSTMITRDAEKGNWLVLGTGKVFNSFGIKQLLSCKDKKRVQLVLRLKGLLNKYFGGDPATGTHYTY